jgi:hypothetical protein
MAIAYQEPTQAERTRGSRRELRYFAIDAFMEASFADPKCQADNDALRELIRERLGTSVLALEFEDAISDLRIEAARPVATAAYHAVFSHVPALYMSDAEYAAACAAEIEAGR